MFPEMPPDEGNIQETSERLDFMAVSGQLTQVRALWKPA